jgi:hypothetical protein
MELWHYRRSPGRIEPMPGRQSRQVQRPLVPAQTCPPLMGQSRSARAPETLSRREPEARSQDVPKTRFRCVPELGRPWPRCPRRPGPQQPHRQRRVCGFKEISLLSFPFSWCCGCPTSAWHWARAETRRSSAPRTPRTRERGISVALTMVLPRRRRRPPRPL